MCHETTRRCPWMLATAVLAWSAVAAADPKPSLDPSQVMCLWLDDYEKSVCQTVCTAWPASQECLLVRRFRSDGAKAYHLSRTSGTDIEKAGLSFGLGPDEARRLMLVLDAIGAVPRAWVAPRTLSPEEEAALREAAAAGDEAKRLAEAGNLKEARKAGERSITLREGVLGPEHPDTARALDAQGQILRTMGDLEAARHHKSRALESREKVLGPDHPDTATSRFGLGEVLREQGDLALARKYLEGALRVREEVLAGYPETADAAEALGMLLGRMGDIGPARERLELALKIRAFVLGPEHRDTARAMHNLGAFFYQVGDLAAARPYFEEALAVHERTLGPDHPDTLESLNNLAAVLFAAGDMSAAGRHMERIVAIEERTLGRGHPQTATGLNNLGKVLLETGELARARTLLERAMAIHEGDKAPDTLETARVSGNLALLFLAMGKPAEARPPMERALSIRTRLLGPQHLEMAETLLDMARLEWACENPELAKQHLRDGIRMVRQRVCRHFYGVSNLTRLAGVLESKRRVLDLFLSLFSDPSDEFAVLEQLVAWQGALSAARDLSRESEAARSESWPLSPEVSREDYRDARMHQVGWFMIPPKDASGETARTAALTAAAETVRKSVPAAAGAGNPGKASPVVQGTPAEICDSLEGDGDAWVLYARYAGTSPMARNDPATAADERWTPRYLALVVEKAGCRVRRVELGAASAIEGTVDGLRDAGKALEACMQAATDGREAGDAECSAQRKGLDAARKAAREVVWNPVVAGLTAGGRIAVIPDGCLVGVPLDDLRDGDDRFQVEGRTLACHGANVLDRRSDG